jgi:hypothetical protein
MKSLPPRIGGLQKLRSDSVSGMEISAFRQSYSSNNLKIFKTKHVHTGARKKFSRSTPIVRARSDKPYESSEGAASGESSSEVIHHGNRNRAAAEGHGAQGTQLLGRADGR